jgi:hypothetical protein
MTYAFPPIPERIQWHEGMLLAPQHFQQTQARTDALAGWHAIAAAPLAWGVRHLEVDAGLLANGLLRVLALDAVMPDGTAVWHDASCAEHGLLELDLAEHAAALEEAPQEIWLTLPDFYKFVLKTSTEVLLGTWDNIQGYSSGSVAYAATEVQIATAGQTLFVLTEMFYNPGTNTLAVFIDGVNQVVNNSYVESTSTSVTFMSGLHVGAVVKFVNVNVASADASAVSYEPGFVGSVATTVEAKLQQTVSVKDFGAVGDGVTDDSAAFQAAIDAESSVFVPPGNYVIGTMIDLSARDFSIVGVKGETVLSAAADNAIFGISTAGDGEGAYIFGLEFSALTSGTGTGIYSPSSVQIAWWNIDNCVFNSRLKYGINGPLQSCIITATLFGFHPPTGANFQAVRSVGQLSPLVGPYATTFSSCEFARITNVDYGVEFQYGYRPVFQNCIFEANTVNIAIIYVFGTYYPVLDTCWFEQNGCDSLVKLSLDAVSGVDAVLLDVKNTVIAVGTTASARYVRDAIFDFDNTVNANLAFTNNTISGTSCPLSIIDAGAVKTVVAYGNYSTNPLIPMLPTDPANFGTGVVAAGVTSNGLLTVDHSAATVAVYQRNGGTAANTSAQFKGATTSFYHGIDASGNYVVRYNSSNLTAGWGVKVNTTRGLSVDSTDAIWTSGSGSPEGVVTAVVGSFYSRTDGGAGTSFYVKESGTGNTGWAAK